MKTTDSALGISNNPGTKTKLGPERISFVGPFSLRSRNSYNRNMIRETFPVGPLQCNCSLIVDENTKEAIVIDPGDEIPEILKRLEKHSAALKQIIVTHGHIDHVGGALLLKQSTGAPIYMNEKDLPLLKMMEMQAGWIGIRPPEVAPPDVNAEEGTIIGLTTIPATVLHTPGHTPGSICLHFDTQKLLIAGDTLFAGSIGRTDLPGGDPNKILRSIHDRLMILPDDTTVIPGHGVRTTIAQEKEFNPFLKPGISL